MGKNCVCIYYNSRYKHKTEGEWLQMDVAWKDMRNAHITICQLVDFYSTQDEDRSQEFLKAQKLIESEMRSKHPAMWSLYRQYSPKLPVFADFD